jgi:hypothetical protein
METVSHATASRSSAYEALPLIRDTLARTHSYSATARMTGYSETTIRLLLDPPKARASYSPPAPPAPPPAMPHPSPTALSPREIIMLCCAEEGLSYADITSQCRRHYLARPRQRFMWLMRKAKPNISLPEIARRFNKKDHTTVLHALQVTEERYHRDDDERAKLDALLAALKEIERPMEAAQALDAEISELEARIATLKVQRAAISARHLKVAA